VPRDQKGPCLCPTWSRPRPKSLSSMVQLASGNLFALPPAAEISDLGLSFVLPSHHLHCTLLGSEVTETEGQFPCAPRNGHSVQPLHQPFVAAPHGPWRSSRTIHKPHSRAKGAKHRPGQVQHPQTIPPPLFDQNECITYPPPTPPIPPHSPKAPASVLFLYPSNSACLPVC